MIGANSNGGAPRQRHVVPAVVPPLCSTARNTVSAAVVAACCYGCNGSVHVMGSPQRPAGFARQPQHVGNSTTRHAQLGNVYRPSRTLSPSGCLDTTVQSAFRFTCLPAQCRLIHLLCSLLPMFLLPVPLRLLLLPVLLLCRHAPRCVQLQISCCQQCGALTPPPCSPSLPGMAAALLMPSTILWTGPARQHEHTYRACKTAGAGGICQAWSSARVCALRQEPPHLARTTSWGVVGNRAPCAHVCSGGQGAAGWHCFVQFCGCIRLYVAALFRHAVCHAVTSQILDLCS